MKTSFPATHKRIAVVGSVRVSSYFFFALQHFFFCSFRYADDFVRPDVIFIVTRQRLLCVVSMWWRKCVRIPFVHCFNFFIATLFMQPRRHYESSREKKDILMEKLLTNCFFNLNFFSSLFSRHTLALFYPKERIDLSHNKSFCCWLIFFTKFCLASIISGDVIQLRRYDNA